jgi:cysteine dioxygenase
MLSVLVCSGNGRHKAERCRQSSTTSPVKATCNGKNPRRGRESQVGCVSYCLRNSHRNSYQTLSGREAAIRHIAPINACFDYCTRTQLRAIMASCRLANKGLKGMAPLFHTLKQTHNLPPFVTLTRYNHFLAIPNSSYHQPNFTFQPTMDSTPSTRPRDSTRPSPEPTTHFDALVSSINKILGPSNGIDSAGVNVQDLQDAMLAYTSNEADWAKYALSDPSRGYTRNLVDNCNGKSNLLILVWSPGKGSPIHDHANAHCVMKVLKGTLQETLYGWPCQRADNPATCAHAEQQLQSDCPSPEHTCSAGSAPLQPAALQIHRDIAYGEDQVTYMSDKLGLHRIANPSETEFAVSLHLYTVCCAPIVHNPMLDQID